MRVEDEDGRVGLMWRTKVGGEGGWQVSGVVKDSGTPTCSGSGTRTGSSGGTKGRQSGTVSQNGNTKLNNGDLECATGNRSVRVAVSHVDNGTE